MQKVLKLIYCRNMSGVVSTTPHVIKTKDEERGFGVNKYHHLHIYHNVSCAHNEQIMRTPGCQFAKMS